MMWLLLAKRVPAWALFLVLVTLVMLRPAESFAADGGRKKKKQPQQQQKKKNRGNTKTRGGLPAWAEGPETWVGCTQSCQDYHRLNAAETSNEYDVIVYGDSITAGVREVLKTPWRTTVEPHFTGLRVAWWGVPGNDVEDLTWRIMSGAEVAVTPPKVVVLWIGTNSLNQGRDPVEHLDFLMDYLRKTLPLTRLVFLNILPNTRYPVEEANARMRDVCAKHGATFADCGSTLNPADRKLIPDGVHPSPVGYRAIMKCLGPLVRQLAQQQPAPQPAPLP